MTRRLALAGALAILAAGCSDGSADFDVASQIGADPKLPPLEQFLLPPLNVPSAVGWADGDAPQAPPGFRVQPLIRNIASPREMLALPNGDILVVQGKGPELDPVTRPKSPIIQLMEKRAHGQGGVKQPDASNRVMLVRDANGDGVPELTTVLIPHLFSPFGIAYADGYLYVAATDALLRFPFTPGQTRIDGPGEVLTELPGGPIDHHWTKSLTLSPDGKLLYVGVGSNSNIVENGFEAEKGRAAIWEVDRATGRKRLYATGLRNPNGLKFYPGTGTLWAVINERDEIGANLPPDYMTSVKDGGFYGWPYSYWGQHPDPRVRPQRPDMVAKAIVPDYGLSSHVAPLGLAFYTGGAFPVGFRGGAFVGEHGSWDRMKLNGYKVVFVPFAGARPAGKAADFLTGFVGKDGRLHGRPVGVELDRTGALLVADDVGNVVWRVSAASPGA
jgi:glucose/arabinose dehydrogenase